MVMQQLFLARKVTLIIVVVQAIPSYIMSTFLVLKWVYEEMDSLIMKVLWNVKKGFNRFLMLKS